MFESLYALHRDGPPAGRHEPEEAEQRVIKAIGKGLLKILSKMGISTIRSYTGAQIFEAVGLERELVDRHFTGTASRIGGVGLEVLAREALDRHARAYPAATSELLPAGGVYHWRRGGEFHGWNPETIASSSTPRAARTAREAYERFARYVNDVAARSATLRGLLRFRDDVDPLPLDEVEPATEIVRRFKSGGMILGALSPEAHETLAVGMNRLGGKSNTGEGGEDPARFEDERRSSIKQVASGRFGVTVDYLVNADELQIKVAQGAKPGEGGQLPGPQGRPLHRAACATRRPGVGLISPPPHHDIYSIEDLKQLIYDLRCANPRARVSVKLVSEVGVGTVAAGVAKANADHVVIAGHDGGTGASPQASIQHAGIPWEIGLAETQQTLLRNDLRSRIMVEVDGQMRTGRDVVDRRDARRRRVRLLDRPADRARLRDDARLPPQHLPGRRRHPGPGAAASASRASPSTSSTTCSWSPRRRAGSWRRSACARVEELIGRTDLLEPDEAVDHWKARGIDLRPLLARARRTAPRTRRAAACGAPEPGALRLDRRGPARSAARPGDRGRASRSRLERRIENKNRAVGGLLSGEIARRHGERGPARGHDRGAPAAARPGQSFGAWLARGRRRSCSTATPTTTSARACPAARSSCARRRDGDLQRPRRT